MNPYYDSISRVNRPNSIEHNLIFLSELGYGHIKVIGRFLSDDMKEVEHVEKMGLRLERLDREAMKNYADIISLPVEHFKNLGLDYVFEEEVFRCRDCRFWTNPEFDGETFDGICRFNPPVKEFPVTKEDDWCRNHSMRTYK